VLKPGVFSSDALKSVALQMSRRPSRLMRASVLAGSRIELAETFDVFELSLPVAESISGRLRTELTANGQWHHQIRHGADAKEFALSGAPQRDSENRLLQVSFASPIAQNIDSAIDWMDNNHGQVPDGSVHLLFAPTLLIHAFWIETAESDFVVVADSPAAITTLERERFYDADKFLKLLASIPGGRGLVEP
jgi:hypothetical protein